MTPFERYTTVRQVLGRELGKAYGYGWSQAASDCFFTGLAVADALDPALGLVEAYRGSYTTLAGAQRALRKRGLASLEALFERHLKPVAPAGAIIGDLAVLRLADGDHVGVCDGTGFVTKLPRGRASFGPGQAAAAFAVGER